MMGKIVLACVLLTIFSVVLADHHRPGKYLKHDRTVVNCAKYNRKANQHSCVLSTFNTEGPYFLPDDLKRSDIKDGQVGIPLHLTINLVNSNDCNPLDNMYVHIWHANATGRYSGVNNVGGGSDGQRGVNNGTNFGSGGRNESTGLGAKDGMESGGPGDAGMGNGGRPTPINDERFFRGYQITDSNGQVTFETIIPGWYSGRAMHIHIEVFSENTTETNDITYVGQIFFDRDLPILLQTIDHYSTNTQEIVLNDDDWIYVNHGNESLLDLQPNGNGFSSTVTFGINLYGTQANNTTKKPHRMVLLRLNR